MNLPLTLLVLALAAAPAPAPKTFPSIAKGQVLFRMKVPEAGRWKFCLRGTKPPKDSFIFHALVAKADGLYRVDRVRGTAPADTAIDACAAMEASEVPLTAGSDVSIEAILPTAGPVTLTLTAERVP
jgi:hypothetical protein